MGVKRLFFIASMFTAAIAIATPSQAQLVGDLLGSLGIGDGGGGGDSPVTVSSGTASDSGAVNAGVGSGPSDPGNLADVNTGSNNLLRLNLRSGSNGGTGGTLNLLGGTGTGDLNLLGGGDGGPLTGGINLAGLGINFGTSGGTGGGGGNGNGGPGFGGSGSSAAVAIAALNGANCSANEGRQVLEFAAQAKFSASIARQWNRYSNVEIVPVRICNTARRQVAQILSQSGKVNALQQSVAMDPLISASLQRSRKDAGDVFAVDASGGGLKVYVY